MGKNLTLEKCRFGRENNSQFCIVKLPVKKKGFKQLKFIKAAIKAITPF